MDRWHLFNIISFILAEEVERLKQEMAHRDLTVAFDGTTWLCEGLVVVVCMVGDDWYIKKCLVRIKLS